VLIDLISELRFLPVLCAEFDIGMYPSDAFMSQFSPFCCPFFLICVHQYELLQTIVFFGGEVVIEEVACFAPILVTPLGALSIIIISGTNFESQQCILLNRCFSYFITHLNIYSQCCACAYNAARGAASLWHSLMYPMCLGSTTIILHTPLECGIESVTQVWDLATEPDICYYILFYPWFWKNKKMVSIL
jgi:hypothetical protein